MAPIQNELEKNNAIDRADAAEEQEKFCREDEKKLLACEDHGPSSILGQHDNEKLCSDEETCPFVIQKGEIGGMECIATRDLSPGTIVIQEFPINYSLEFKSTFDEIGDEVYCVTCGSEISADKENNIEDSNLCSGCGWPVCGEECAKASIHALNECLVLRHSRKECSLLVAGSRRNVHHALGSFCTYMIRGLGLQKQDPHSYEQFISLMYEHPIKESERQIELTAARQFDWFVKLSSPLEYSEEEYQRVLRVGMINSFSINGTVSATYLTASRLNHSCVPNCAREINHKNFQITVRTAVPIRKGEPLTISYFLGHERGTIQRHRNILAHWGCGGFLCNCPLCRDPTELDTFMSAIRCQNCLADSETCKNGGNEENTGYYLPTNSLHPDEEEMEWECNGCFRIQSGVQILKIVDQLFYDFQIEKECTRNADKISSREWENFCTKIMEEYSGLILHPNHWLVQEAAENIVLMMEKEERESSREDVEKYIKLLKYLLDIKDKTKPGCTKYRANLLLKIIGSELRIVKEFEDNLSHREKISHTKSIHFQDGLNEFMKGQPEESDMNVTFQEYTENLNKFVNDVKFTL